jgi:Helix-hairpin-helix domain
LDRPLGINQQVADRLREMADLLEQQEANYFRINAYRRAAETVGCLDCDLRRLVADRGLAGLKALPTVGQGIAAAILEIVSTGRWSQLERLRGSLDPARLFQTIPGVSSILATRLHDTLHVDSLEALEAAAHDGRLRAVQGIGPRRAQALRSALANMLGRIRSRPKRTEAEDPGVALLLDIDKEYLEKAKSEKLPLISPKRFNPAGQPSLPILHAERSHWHFTALYSNSPRAHELGRTRDWVVVYYYDAHHREGQATVVTETQGTLIGKRVVRGREAECLKHYAQQTEGGSRQTGMTGWLDFSP